MNYPYIIREVQEPIYEIIDVRTGKPATSTVWRKKQHALSSIKGMLRREMGSVAYSHYAASQKIEPLELTSEDTPIVCP